MKLEIVGIQDRGVAYRERVLLRALADANLSYYVIIATSYSTPQALSTKMKATYWFPPKAVRAGDSITVYTGPGVNSSQINANGNTDHIFYWELPSTVWKHIGECATVFEVNTWKTTPYE